MLLLVSIFNALIVTSCVDLGVTVTRYSRPSLSSFQSKFTLYLVQEPLRDDEVSMLVIQERWKGDVLWIDARIQEQFDAEHIPGGDISRL